MNKKPVVCVLLGDASGVGSEILVKAFGGDAKVPEAVRVALLGDERVLARAEELIGKKISYKLVKPEEIRETEEDIVMVDTKNVDQAQATFAKVNAVCGKAVVEDIKAA